MKRIIILLLLSGSSYIAFAQETVVAPVLVNPGGLYIKGGLNLANISVNDNGAADNANQLATFNLGILGDIPLGDILSFQTGIIANGEGSKTTNNTFGTTTRFNPWYVQ